MSLTTFFLCIKAFNNFISICWGCEILLRNRKERERGAERIWRVKEDASWEFITSREIGVCLMK